MTDMLRSVNESEETKGLDPRRKSHLSLVRPGLVPAFLLRLSANCPLGKTPKVINIWLLIIISKPHRDEYSALPVYLPL